MAFGQCLGPQVTNKYSGQIRSNVMHTLLKPKERLVLGCRDVEEIPPGGFRGDEQLPFGGFRGDEQLPPGGFRT